MHVRVCVYTDVWLPLGRNLQEGAGQRRSVGTRVGAGKDGEESRDPAAPGRGLRRR